MRLLSACIVALTLSSSAFTQQQPPRLPAPIFRVPYGLSPQTGPAPDSTSLACESPQYGPVLPPPRYRASHRHYALQAGLWGGPPQDAGLIAGLLLTAFFVVIFALPH